MSSPTEHAREILRANPTISRAEFLVLMREHNLATASTQYSRQRKFLGLDDVLVKTTKLTTPRDDSVHLIAKADELKLSLFPSGQLIVTDDHDILDHDTDGALFQCKFTVDSPDAAGLYAWFVDAKLVYIGEASKSLRRRHNQNYGRYSKSRMAANGPRHDVRLNAKIAEALLDGRTVRIEWLVTPEFDIFEKHLIRIHRPPWNKVGVRHDQSRFGAGH